ncbi:MAG: phosphoribosyltransferase [Elusimicrobia bacterium]|nr:phosphoribosyltransferase [Elusimicrobiota bacterium]
MIFEDRRAAGRALAGALARWPGPWINPLVIALPRGGVPVGHEVALSLRAEFDILCVRKLGAPGRPELAIGALADGGEPLTVLNQGIISQLGVSPSYVEEEIARQTRRLAQLEKALRQGRPVVPRRGRDVVLVDDGLATGATARAALQRLRRDDVHRLILAVPVSPPEILKEFRALTDGVVCLHSPPDFNAVGAYYAHFGPVSEIEVLQLTAPRPVSPQSLN